MSQPQPTPLQRELEELAHFASSGIDHCRAGRWEKGVEYLEYVAARHDPGASQRGLFYSYLGCAVARVRREAARGRALCERAVEIEFYQPENWANLAEVLLLLGSRGEAIVAVEEGLQIDPQFARLLELRQRLGLRRRPVLGFVERRNPINHLLGVLRHQIRRGGLG